MNDKKKEARKEAVEEEGEALFEVKSIRTGLKAAMQGCVDGYPVPVIGIKKPIGPLGGL